MSDGEIVVPLRAANPSLVAPLTHVRSTLLSASLLAITKRGLADAYFAQLPRELHDTMRTLVAGSWVPLDIAEPHYAAMSCLGFTPQDAMQIGGEVGDRVQASLLGVVFRVAKGSGVTPWTAITMYTRLWERMFQGGEGRVVKLGPKEARFDNFGISLVSHDYFRHAWRGMTVAALSLFCRKVFVNEVSHSPTNFSFRASWV